jgi:membrane associated rhomboid family serine protease
MEHFRDSNYRAVGASGAISGLVSSFAIFAPLAMFLFPPVPAIIYAVGFILWSAWAASTNVRDGIGHSAHLGGALAGVAIVCLGWPHAPQQMIDQIVASVSGF